MPFLFNPIRVDYETQPSFRTLDELLYRYPADGANDILLPAGNKYIFDAQVFDLGVYTLVPEGALSIAFTTNMGELTSSKTSGSLIRSEYTLYLESMKLTTVGSTYAIEMDGITGDESIDGIGLQFGAGTNLGRLNGIRQAYFEACFSSGANSGFLVQGIWSGGFKITNSLFLSLNDYLIKTEVGSEVQNIRSDVNVTCNVGCTIFDVDYANITNDSGFNLNGANLQGLGVAFKTFSGGDTTIAENSRKCFFINNTGSLAKNTSIGGAWELTTEVVTPLLLATRTKVLGGTTYDSLVHFISDGDNGLVYNSSITRTFSVTANISLDGNPNVAIDLFVVKKPSGGGADIIVGDQIGQIFSFVGSSDRGIFAVRTSNFTLSEGDKIQLDQSNLTNVTNTTALIGSKLFIDLV